MLVREYLAGQARSRPEHLAYVAGPAHRSWSETADRSGRLAAAWRSLGLRAGEVVASLSQDGLELVEVWFASATLGTVRTGINWRYAPREIEHILRDAAVAVLVVEGGTCEEAFGSVDRTSLTALRHVIGFGDHHQDLDYEEIIAEQEALPRDEWPPLSEDDPIAISYTSGSTGLPKGAIWTQRAVVATELNTWVQVGVRHDDVFLHCLPAAGVPVLLATWNVFVGSTIVLLPRFAAAAALRSIQDHRVTSTLLVPTMMLDLLDHPDLSRTDLSSLRTVMYGSAPATPALVRRAMQEFGCELQQWYGATEGAAGWFSILHHEDHLRALASDPGLLQSCGRPTVHTEIAIVSEAGQRLPANEVGEIAVRSETLMSGYLGLPDETRQVLQEPGWLRTGDMGRIDEDGYLYLVDRKKFMIITGGYNVYPVVVENVLAEHPAVREAAVVGVPDERWGEAVGALVVSDGTVTGEDLMLFCTGRLARFEVPKHVVLVDRLPRGATGKVLKRAVREQLLPLSAAPATLPRG
jgi:acyl-CoA synthetase (AMP-forming)/AMP-acid ligase II